MCLGMFWVNIWGCQNHPQMKMWLFLALTRWGHGCRPLSCRPGKPLGSFPSAPWALACFHLCASAREEEGGGGRRREEARCLSPSKQQWNSLAWLFSNPLPAGCLPFLWEHSESHLRSAFGPSKPHGLGGICSPTSARGSRGALELLSKRRLGGPSGALQDSGRARLLAAHLEVGVGGFLSLSP